MKPRPYRLTVQKRLLKNTLVMWAAAIIVSLLIRMIYWTCRVHKEIPAASLPYAEGAQQAIFCFWHGRMLLQPFVKPPRPMRVLMSTHSDGKIVQILMRCFNIGSISGSRNRHPGKAMRSMLEVVGRGSNIAITPDGPRGPLQQAAPGATFLAAKTGLPLIAISFSASRHRRLHSWDRFMIPLPFARVCYVAHAPMHIAADADDAALERANLQLEQALNQTLQRADQRCGVAA